MSYRNDLEAARHREAMLRDALADRELEIAGLRQDEVAPTTPTKEDPAEDLEAEVALFASWRVPLRSTLKSVGLVAIFGGVPLASCLLPYAIEASCDQEQAAKRELARKDDALFTHVVELRWLGKVSRSEGAYFAPETRCEISAKLRGDGGERLRGSVAVMCGKILLHEENVDQIRCQLEEERKRDGAWTYRMRCLSPPDDGVRPLDIDTKQSLCEVMATDRKSDVFVTINETSEPRWGGSFR